jgi:hypothetical protein
MLSFRIPLMLCLMASGICWIKSYDLFNIQAYSYSLVLLVIAGITLGVSGILLGKAEINAYNSGYETGVNVSEEFTRLLKRQKEREE